MRSAAYLVSESAEERQFGSALNHGAEESRDHISPPDPSNSHSSLTL